MEKDKSLLNQITALESALNNLTLAELSSEERKDLMGSVSDIYTDAREIMGEVEEYRDLKDRVGMEEYSPDNYYDIWTPRNIQSYLSGSGHEITDAQSKYLLNKMIEGEYPSYSRLDSIHKAVKDNPEFSQLVPGWEADHGYSFGMGDKEKRDKLVFIVKAVNDDGQPCWKIYEGNLAMPSWMRVELRLPQDNDHFLNKVISRVYGIDRGEVFDYMGHRDNPHATIDHITLWKDRTISIGDRFNSEEHGELEVARFDYDPRKLDSTTIIMHKIYKGVATSPFSPETYTTISLSRALEDGSLKSISSEPSSSLESVGREAKEASDALSSDELSTPPKGGPEL